MNTWLEGKKHIYFKHQLDIKSFNIGNETGLSAWSRLSEAGQLLILLFFFILSFPFYFLGILYTFLLSTSAFFFFLTIFYNFLFMDCMGIMQNSLFMFKICCITGAVLAELAISSVHNVICLTAQKNRNLYSVFSFVSYL